MKALLEQAEANNLELAAMRTRSDEARGNLRQAGVKPPLTLEVGGASGRPLRTVGEEEYSAGVGKTFETGGKRARRIDAAEVRLTQTAAEYQERVRQLGYEIKSRYADVLTETQRIEVLDQILASSQRSLELTKARVEGGDAAQLEQTLLDVEIGRLMAQRATVAGRRESALADLRRVTGLAPGSDIALGSTFYSGPIASAMDTLNTAALEQRPDLKLARLVEQLGDAELRLVEAEGRPDVSVTARYFKRNGQLDNLYGVNAQGARVLLRDRDDILAVGISIPILTKNRNLGNFEAAQARILSARQRARYLMNSIPLEVESAWRRWSAARSTAGSLESAVMPQAQRNLDVIQQAYQLGQLRLLDVLNEQRRLLDLRLSTVDAQAEAARAFAELERAVGGLIR
ncbi:MAG: TolC family protein [Bryobacteraceae bacterium]|nr:TolC family protein [Bryobacteraceae bacterium]